MIRVSAENQEGVSIPLESTPILARRKPGENLLHLLFRHIRESPLEKEKMLRKQVQFFKMVKM